MQFLCDLQDAMSHHWSPSTSQPTYPREAEHFPKGCKYPKDVPLPMGLSLLVTSLIKNSGLVFIDVKIMNVFTCGEGISKLAV